MDLPETTNSVDTQDEHEDERVRSGPLRHHALWAALVTAAGVTLGWLGALFRIGPEEYGLPPAAPGALWPYLLAWAVIGLGLSAILRFVAAKVPVYSPSEVLLGTVMIGTRLSLGWRPEPSKSRAWPRPHCSWWLSGAPSHCAGRPSCDGPTTLPGSPRTCLMIDLVCGSWGAGGCGVGADSSAAAGC